MTRTINITDTPSLGESIDTILPQTQCRRCGYPGCRPYADAIAAGVADFNQCPPGGSPVVDSLARLLGRPSKPLNLQHGREEPRALARIVEQRCIGCTLCIQACPVDAIVGAPGFLHRVIEDRCTGCDLCLPPCPVDCISRVPAEPVQGHWTPARASAARQHYSDHNARLQRDRQFEEARSPEFCAFEEISPSLDGTHKSALITAALSRARARKSR